MLDSDLAALYGVPSKRLNEAVARNRQRFPVDFMFQLTALEYDTLRSQIATSNADGRGGRRYRPYAFTEQGVAMLSSVLRSERAIAVNILIIRAFVRLRAALGETAEIRRHIVELEHRLDEHGEILGKVIEPIDALSGPTEAPVIGFRAPPVKTHDDVSRRLWRPLRK